MRRVAAWNDLSFGLFLVVAGIVGWLAATDLPSGTLLRMGPGWMPHALALLLVLVGAMLTVRGFVRAGAGLEAWALRPAIFALLAVGFFAVSIEPLGLPIAVGGTVLIGSLADRGARFVESVALALFLAAGTTLLFVEGLGLPIQVWPEAFG